MFLQILKESLEMGFRDALTETVMVPVRKLKSEALEELRIKKEKSTKM